MKIGRYDLIIVSQYLACRWYACNDSVTLDLSHGHRAKIRHSRIAAHSLRNPGARRAIKQQSLSIRRPRRRPQGRALECRGAERALRLQCSRVRGLGRVRQRVQLPLLTVPRDDRLGFLALGRDRAREVPSDEG